MVTHTEPSLPKTLLDLKGFSLSFVRSGVGQRNSDEAMKIISATLSGAVDYILDKTIFSDLKGGREN